VLVDLFRPRAKLEAEILVLGQQINVLRRTAPKRLLLSSIDRLLFVGLYRLFPDVRGALTIVKPDTVIRWHRAGFRAYWRWKSRTRRGRPKVPLEIRQLIRDMSFANPLWGAPRIHGELLKLGIDVGQTSVAKYMARRRRPPSQGWTTFLRKPCRRDRRNGSFRGADDFVPASVWFADLAPRPTRDLMAGGHRAPDRRVDRSSAH
jgi:hypothetical protein